MLPTVPLMRRRPPGPRGLLILSGILFSGVLCIALCARLDIPMVPAPMSLQTYAVLLVGDWRDGVSPGRL